MAVNLRINISTTGKNRNGEWRIRRKTGIPGEDAKGVIDAFGLAERTRRDPSFRLKGETLVIGGNDTAFESALLAVRCGSEKVTVICPEQGDEMRASEDLIAQAEQNNVQVIHGWGPLRIDVHTDGLVSGVFLKHCVRAFDDEGKFSPIYDENNVRGQYCDNLVLAIN